MNMMVSRQCISSVSGSICNGPPHVDSKVLSDTVHHLAIFPLLAYFRHIKLLFLVLKEGCHVLPSERFVKMLNINNCASRETPQFRSNVIL